MNSQQVLYINLPPLQAYIWNCGRLLTQTFIIFLCFRSYFNYGVLIYVYHFHSLSHPSPTTISGLFNSNTILNSFLLSLSILITNHIIICIREYFNYVYYFHLYKINEILKSNLWKMHFLNTHSSNSPLISFTYNFWYLVGSIR